MSEPRGTPGAAQILVIEDEPQMLRFLRPTLIAHGYRVVTAGTGAEGLRQAASRSPDVILLDLGLPDLDGLEVTRRLRTTSRVPIVVISARGREGDKVEALELGADDYLTKPFGVRELVARIRVALRHAAAQARPGGDPVVSVRGLVVDLDRRRVTVDGTEVRLTPIQYRLLATLAAHVGRVLTHRFLLQEVWGRNYSTQAHYVRVYMAQLRQRIERDPANPAYLVTEPGVGYRLLDE
jgi:two-component system KDP operon response regulator KdpE